ncbi:MAG TPA: lactonase family protein, partial [Rhodothermales bacterium]
KSEIRNQKLVATMWLRRTMGITSASGRDNLRVYVGTYTRGESEGIYLLDLDLKTGALTSRGLVARAENPSFLALHPDGGHLYAANEVSRFLGKRSGGVSAFRIDRKTGSLRFLNRQLTRGGAPCYIAVDGAGSNVLVANYGGGSVAVLPIRENGKLKKPSAFVQHVGSGPDPTRQEGPHAHSIRVDAANRFALAADLGLDKVQIYRYDPRNGALTANDPPHAAVSPGAGPRHLAFHPNGESVYLVNELDLTVTAFQYDGERGALSIIQTISTLPGDVEDGYSGADIHVHPTGRFLYASNRGHDTIAVFAIDSDSGRLTAVGYEPTRGRTLRNFAIDPTGRFLLVANQDSDSVVVFGIDQETGGLTPTGETANVPSPVCIRFVQGEE